MANLTPVSLVLSLLTLWCPALLSSRAGGELEEAVAAFERAAAVADLDARRQALERLTSLGDAGALPVLTAEFARSASRLRRTRDEVDRREVLVRARRARLNLLEQRVRRDRSLASTVEAEREALAGLEHELESLRSTAGELEPWVAALLEGTGALFDRLGPAKQRKVEGDLWKDAEDSPEPEIRLAALEVLAVVGGPGTPTRMAGMIVELEKERSKLRRRLRRELPEVRKLEARLQKESEQQGGRISQASVAQYERAKRAASDLQRKLTGTSHLLDAIVEAGGRALAREEGDALAKDLRDLLRAQLRAKGPARLRTLALLAQARTPLVHEELRSILSEERDPAARAEILDALAAAGDTTIVPSLIESYLADEDWRVRSSAARALATLRAREGVQPLIERLEVEQGRQISDIEEALHSLTGRRFHGNVELWRRWWREHGETFEVPDPAELQAEMSEEAREQVGSTFFGIRTESERVLFVLDLSGSMNFSMVPRNNPNDDPGKPFDMPRKGELSRLEAARRELVKALGGIDDGAVFNLVLYASDVWAWQDELVEMSPQARAEAVRYIESIDAVGGTNIYGALDLALDLAGADGGESGDPPKIDTIFLLSDGRASVGLTTDADEILAHIRERNRGVGITIHTIGLSGAQDAHLLRNLAEQNGGVYAAR